MAEDEEAMGCLLTAGVQGTHQASAEFARYAPAPISPTGRVAGSTGWSRRSLAAGAVLVLGAAAVALAGARAPVRWGRLSSRPMTRGAKETDSASPYVGEYASGAVFECTGDAASLTPGYGDGTTWRCSGGACIMQASKCDGTPNCLDSSDEADCGGAGGADVSSGADAQMTATGAGTGQSGASTDYGSASGSAAGYPAQDSSGGYPTDDAVPGTAAAPGECTEKLGKAYSLSWKASGSTFFDKMNFLLNDPNHGAAQYLGYGPAMQHRVVEAHSTHAIIRAGPKGDHLKRYSVKLETQQKWTYFLMAMKFSHVPFGCGVWPALWTHSPEAAWPNGGEMDILEYSNEIPSRSSFHVGTVNKCKLDASELHRSGCHQMPDAEYNFTGHYECVTDYPDKIGCAPNKMPLLSGEQMSSSPSVVAAEWTESYVKIFRIPESSMPQDLLGDQPTPDEWDQWLIAYYPFAASERNSPGSCPNPANIMKAQQLVLSLGFCGDWASKVWVNSTVCANKGYSQPGMGARMPDQCVAVDPHNPKGEIPGGPRDCCTQFIYDENDEFGAEAYLQKNAYFNISWIKVYQHGRRRLAKRDRTLA